MHQRVLAAAIALICVVPSAAHAQLMPLQDDPTWGPRLRVTPYVGYLPSVTRNEDWIRSSPSGNTFVEVDYKLASGSAIGVNGEVAVRGPWSAIAGVAFASRGDSEFALVNTGEEFEINGSRFVMVKAGGSLTLRERESELTFRRLGASIFAAPFYMRELPRSEAGFENLDVFRASNHFGLNLGASGELPFAKDRMSVQIAIEDYATWFSSDALERLPDSFFENGDPAATTRVETGIAHQWMLRAAVSFRWR